jgi:prepilin signal peptidase PulO-like enzyme (type II secretory pathway)
MTVESLLLAFIPLFLVMLSGFLFASLNSFLAVVAERVPVGLPITGRSVCACGRQLEARENIPVLGYLLARGKTRCCGGLIPANYAVCELICAVSGSVAASLLIVFGTATPFAIPIIALAGCYAYQRSGKN